MTKRDLQAGFAPFIIIAIVAVLAIGGGTYVVSKKKAAKVDTEVQANAEAEVNANANANLGVNAKGSLRSLMGMGKNVMCTFESTSGGTASSGTVYIAANGAMRGDFKAAGLTSSMITKDGYMYGWTGGGQGVKIKMDAQAQASAAADASAQAEVNKSVDLDSQVDYSCSAWSMDASKFTLPAGVEFVDLEAMLKGATGAGAGIDLKGATGLGQ
ncbi:MAG: hypothetical protein M3M85_00705 [bacterium]|nr:hypothetical protein [bacterium]